MSILILILALSFLVIIHELGHFVAAKWQRIKVEEFGLGYPPRLFKLFTWRETEFTINAIPFGGFVKLEGEETPDNIELPVEKLKFKLAGLFKRPKVVEPFFAKTASSRILVIAAGPIMNLIFALLAFSIVFSLLGIPTSLAGQPRVLYVEPNSPAGEVSVPTSVNIVGFREADKLVTTDDLHQVQDYVITKQGETVKMVVTGPCQGMVCDTETTQDFMVYLRRPNETPADQGSMGIVFQEYYLKFYPWYEMPIRGTIYGVNQAVFLGLAILDAVKTLLQEIVFNQGLPSSLVGPVGIVHQAQRSGILEDGFLVALSFAGMLSLNLAIMNLLPLPPLDGGVISLIVLEKFVGRQRVQKLAQYINYGGLALLLALFMLVTARDIITIVNGS